MIRASVVVLLGAVVFPISAARADWRDDLGREIQAAEGCNTQRLWVVTDIPGTGYHVIIARVYCTDGRRYVATKGFDDQPFSFDQCDAPGVRPCKWR